MSSVINKRGRFPFQGRKGSKAPRQNIKIAQKTPKKAPLF